MPNEVLIEKSTGAERWSEDHSIGTMILSGIDAKTAMSAAETAKKLFVEFNVARITSGEWVLLSEELRRGNFAHAATMVSKLPKRLGPTWAGLRNEEDGDDPRDIPPPRIYGEEIEIDLDLPPVYIVSDFHIGSTRMFGAVDKRKSNDMDQKTLAAFLAWMKSVDADAIAYDHYDVIMNGDFLDLWQAKRPSGDSMEGRLADVLKSNASFFEELGKYLRSKYPRCRFYYLIGNHDDALENSDDGSHYRARSNVSTAMRTETELVLLPGGRVKKTSISNKPMPFAMNLRYTNSAYQLLVEHGHLHDPFNRKGNNDEAVGQSIAEFINHMQESDSAFTGVEFTPNQETVEYLACLKGHANTPQRVKDLIEGMQSVAMSAALSDSFFGAIGDGINYLVQGDRSILNHPEVDPREVRKTNAERAKRIIDDSNHSPQVKIVVFGHTHLRDLQPETTESSWAYANSGTWMDEIQAGQTATGCSLTKTPSPLPYVKISKEKGQNKAIVELKFHRGNLAHRAVLVSL